ncbi:cyclic nucleotide-binding domain-containing protein [Magnetospirillum aberrantis]|uniref:Cyclic nucleotide-binding domain-containing protein n=1 Tax=Magnetospirillum aberrantis SpK TaxID=908842 RepID=A0A7C9QTX8_9PROT|nr:cyclic nucleotide-binding domain-containing protein [Magnetospirillum aberrantis]NFV80578.1 cyclic nucleotide-binding domain-containing protein [Magnetospirillum aberrantis SpK]
MVKPRDLGRVIDEHPFFRDMAPDLRAALVCLAVNERFAAGEHLFREGAEARKFYVIREGQVAVEVEPPVRKPIVLETLGAGDVLGWSWLVPPHRAAFAARAQTDLRVLAFDADCLRRAMLENPQLGYAVLARFVPVMAHRLAAARMQMLDLYGPAVAPKDKPAKPKVEKAVRDSKGRNRSAVAALEGVKAEAAATKAELKLAKKGKKADKAPKKKGK